MAFGVAEVEIKNQKIRLKGKPGISHPNDGVDHGALRAGIFFSHVNSRIPADFFQKG
jgi:hypothetical protein